MSQHIERGIVLYNQDRNDLAEKEFRQALARDPSNAFAHAWLAICLAEMGQHQEAEEEARQAVHLGPDLPFSHHAMAFAFDQQDRLEEARKSILEAIRLDPDEASSFALLASIELQRDQWQAALDGAEQGLSLDPESGACANYRAIALVKLGRRDEAHTTLAGSLARDPENALTHANQGWALLHGRQPESAMVHFREALRIEPNMEWARMGIVEAMKSRNFIYRWLLAYFLWMARLSSRAQWGIIIGGYIMYRMLRSVVREKPELAPYLYPLLGAYALFVLLTWIGEPLFNLMLRFSRFGRLALSRDETIAANCLSVCIVLFIAAAVVAWLTGATAALLAALVIGLMVIPLSATLRRPAGKRGFLGIYTGLLALAGGLAVVGAFLDVPGPAASPARTLVVGSMVVFLLGVALFSWVANLVAMRRAGR